MISDSRQRRHGDGGGAKNAEIVEFRVEKKNISGMSSVTLEGKVECMMDSIQGSNLLQSLTYI